MEAITTGTTTLARQLAIGSDDAITDSALGLALERSRDVAAPSEQAVDDRAAAIATATPGVAEVDDTLSGDEPAAPLFLVDGDAVLGFDGGARERVSGGQADGDGHVLLVDGDAGG